MFERYTEKARRVIFFARYEASQFGSRTIEAEHLLLGLTREDRPLAITLLKSEVAMESIRRQIEAHSANRAQISTSVELPISQECKRILAYGAAEAEQLNHLQITTAHLVLGILFEAKSLAARMLRERHVTMESARAYAIESYPQSARVPSPPPPVPAPPPALLLALAEREEAGGITVISDAEVAGRADIAIYEGKVTIPTAALRSQIKQVMKRMEDAIANHDFAAARSYSDQERGLRETLRQLPPQDASPAPVPFLCIFILNEERLTHLRARIDACFAEGVAHIWMLDSHGRRIYTATPAEGLREFLGDTLEIPHPHIAIPRAAFA